MMLWGWFRTPTTRGSPLGNLVMRNKAPENITVAWRQPAWIGNCTWIVYHFFESDILTIYVKHSMFMSVSLLLFLVSFESQRSETFSESFLVTGSTLNEPFDFFSSRRNKCTIFLGSWNIVPKQSLFWLITSVTHFISGRRTRTEAMLIAEAVMLHSSEWSDNLIKW